MKRRIAVLKFGGTSVADPEKISRAAERAVAMRKQGFQVAVVVSAPGEMTDELIGLARRMAPEPDPRELDHLMSTGEIVGISLFCMACRAQGSPAVSLSGPQAGFRCEGPPTVSTIKSIRPKRIHAELDAGRIVAVAGFQALAPNGDTATLGRGGSDLSAVALAAVLKAERCEIFTDVKGVYTADPRVVPDARKLERVSYEEMLELSGAGAQVMLARSIEVAQRYGVRLHVRSAFQPGVGTWIEEVPEDTMEKAHVSSIAHDNGEVRLTVAGLPDRPGVAATVIAALAEGGVPIDMIVQSSATVKGVNDISFMCPRDSARKAKASLAAAAKKLGARGVDLQEGVVKITAVGTGFRRSPKVAALMFSTLAKAKINIEMITTSDLKVCCVVSTEHADVALRALHKAFGLGRRG
ncbi:MAG: aspartate kinase [Elusimicrobia bacterium]|nr:aspartate kinase [Elusimicrobiota bacterium]